MPDVHERGGGEEDEGIEQHHEGMALDRLVLPHIAGHQAKPGQEREERSRFLEAQDLAKRRDGPNDSNARVERQSEEDRQGWPKPIDGGAFRADDLHSLSCAGHQAR